MKMGISETYREWIHKNEPSFTEVMIQKELTLSINPKISIIVPTFNTPRRILIDAIVSVICQTYSNWELCIADGASTDKLKISIILTLYIVMKIKLLKMEISDWSPILNQDGHLIH